MITYLSVSNSSFQKEEEEMAAKKKRVYIKPQLDYKTNSPMCQTFFRNT